jgi:hypothetical protein
MGTGTCSVNERRQAGRTRGLAHCCKILQDGELTGPCRLALDMAGSKAA